MSILVLVSLLAASNGLLRFFVVGGDGRDRQTVLQHVEIFLHMCSLQILQFYLSRGVQLKNELGIKCREVGF